MKTRFIALLILLVSLSAVAANESDESSNAPAAKITGTVLDKMTRETLPGVSITIDATDTKIYSDRNGEFTLEGLKPGTYTMMVSCISYKQQKIEITLGNPSTDAISVQLESVEP